MNKCIPTKITNSKIFILYFSTRITDRAAPQHSLSFLPQRGQSFCAPWCYYSEIKWFITNLTKLKISRLKWLIKDAKIKVQIKLNLSLSGRIWASLWTLDCFSSLQYMFWTTVKVYSITVVKLIWTSNYISSFSWIISLCTIWHGLSRKVEKIGENFKNLRNFGRFQKLLKFSKTFNKIKKIKMVEN